MAFGEKELCSLFMESPVLEADYHTEDSGTMAGSEAAYSKTKVPSIVLTTSEQEQAIHWLINQSFEGIIRSTLHDFHQAEKNARIQSAVIELEQKADVFRKEQGGSLDSEQLIGTNGATLSDGKISLKGNPLQTVKNILCPNCHLPRLLYPRVGFNSRPVPDKAQQYCKNEPAIIIDKHDVHGQRKKGVKGVKGQPRGKKAKKNEAPSPTSEASDPATPSNSQPELDFEFKEIEFPAAKCPNKDSHLGDHWKSVNVFATHLHGSCYLGRDRKAGREANSKISSTPRDSRASSPKTTNGVKRARAADDNESSGKKKQKVDSPRKNAKKTFPGPSKLRDTANEQDESSSFTTETSDTIQVAAKGDSLRKADGIEQAKLKTNGIAAKKKPTKVGKKASK